MADTKKILPYVIFGVPIAIGLYFVYKAVKSKFGKGKNYADWGKVAAGKIAFQQHPGSSSWRNVKIRLL